MDAAGQEHYVEDWPKYRRFQDLPFARLIDLSREVRVRFGCL